jgi:hypothetical protein
LFDVKEGAMAQLYARRTILGFAISAIPLAAGAQSSFPDQLRGLLNRPPATQTPNSGRSKLSEGQIGLGLKDALKVASRRVIGRLGKLDGYNGDPDIRIPLPGILQGLEGPLKAVGATGILDDLRLKMNRAAERAAPKALNIFVDAATNMTFDDARGILTGPQDAATEYFRRTTSNSLTSEFHPIVDSTLSSVGAVMAFNAVKARASAIPFFGQSVIDFSLTDFTVGKALDGLFHYLAVEEAAIRTNPVARTTDLLRQVFG